MAAPRDIQINSLLDTCESQARILRRGAENLQQTGREAEAQHKLNRAIRFELIASECRRRLEENREIKKAPWNAATSQEANTPNSR